MSFKLQSEVTFSILIKNVWFVKNVKQMTFTLNIQHLLKVVTLNICFYFMDTSRYSPQKTSYSHL